MQEESLPVSRASMEAPPEEPLNHAPPAEATDVEAAISQVKFSGLQKQLNKEAWNSHVEDLLRSWGEKAAGLRWMHLQEAVNNKSLSKKLSIPIVAITTLSGMGSFGGGSSGGSSYLLYSIGVLNVIAALIASMQRLYNPDEKQACHTDNAKQFGAFYREILLELSQPRADRTNPEQLSKWAKKEYDRLMSESLAISQATIVKYNKAFPQQRNKPDIACDVLEIEIAA